MEIIDKEKCCGCGSCVLSCPVHCIIMASDENGFFYPEIDCEKCVQCFSCQIHCPVYLVNQTKNGA